MDLKVHPYITRLYPDDSPFTRLTVHTVNPTPIGMSPGARSNSDSSRAENPSSCTHEDMIPEKHAMYTVPTTMVGSGRGLDLEKITPTRKSSSPSPAVIMINKKGPIALMSRLPPVNSIKDRANAQGVPIAMSESPALGRSLRERLRPSDCACRLTSLALQDSHRASPETSLMHLEQKRR